MDDNRFLLPNARYCPLEDTATRSTPGPRDVGRGGRQLFLERAYLPFSPFSLLLLVEFKYSLFAFLIIILRLLLFGDGERENLFRIKLRGDRLRRRMGLDEAARGLSSMTLEGMSMELKGMGSRSSFLRCFAGMIDGWMDGCVTNNYCFKLNSVRSKLHNPCCTATAFSRLFQKRYSKSPADRLANECVCDGSID